MAPEGRKHCENSVHRPEMMHNAGALSFKRFSKNPPENPRAIANA